MKILKYSTMKRATSLKASIDVEVPAMGLILVGIKEFQKDGKRWFKLPDREFRTPEGELRYAQVVKWIDAARGERFNEELGALVDAFLAEPQPVAIPEQNQELPF